MSEGFLDTITDFYSDKINDHVTYKALGAHGRDARFKNGILMTAEIEGTHAEFWKEVWNLGAASCFGDPVCGSCG